jgi:hypothetical protein
VKNGKNCQPKIKIKKETSLPDHVMFKNQDYFLYTSGNVLKTKTGDSACPLPLTTPGHCDSAVLPLPGSS